MQVCLLAIPGSASNAEDDKDGDNTVVYSRRGVSGFNNPVLIVHRHIPFVSRLTRRSNALRVGGLAVVSSTGLFATIAVVSMLPIAPVCTWFFSALVDGTVSAILF